MGLLSRIIYTLTAPLRMLLSSPGRLFSPLQRLAGLSLPARVAILTAIFLVILVVTAFVAFLSTQGRAGVSYWLTWTRVPLIVLLVVAIPVVVYKALKLWLEGDVSPFPDIDRAWKAGLAELQQQGLDLSEVPLFLILGSAGPNQEKAVFDAARLDLNIREIPQGPAALHWYANPDGIYLVCTDTSCLSKLSHLAATVAEEEASRAGPVSPQPVQGTGRGTIIAGGENFLSEAVPPAGPPSGAPSGGPAEIRGTMIVGGEAAMSGGFGAAEVASSAERRVVKLDQRDVTEQARRLEYLCRLIRRTRQPLCPINALLTLLPFGLIQRSAPEGIEVQRALRKDLDTILRVLMLRCPATAMVVGMEEESGFRELVRRVGHDRAAGQRFGKGFSVSNPPIPERMEALAAHACGSFEDWVYTLFREKGSLSKPGNAKLYALLCKIRRRVQSRLANILATGYGGEGDSDWQAEACFFGGCYFAATGETADRQAFVKGVFDKLPEQQAELQWTEDAYREDQRYQQFAQLGLGLDTLLLLAMAVIIGGWWLGRF